MIRFVMNLVTLSFSLTNLPQLCSKKWANNLALNLDSLGRIKLHRFVTFFAAFWVKL
jgi:hypothetical protein